MNYSNANPILTELDRVIIDLLIHAPFFGRLLTKMVKVIDPNCFGISIILVKQETVRLYINPEYWSTQLKSDTEKQTIQLRKSALKKQLIHFIFNHETQIHDFGNAVFFIISAELVTNQYLEDDEKLAGMVLPNSFPNLKLIPFKKLSYYYDIISNELNSSELNKIIDFNSKPFDYFKFWKSQRIAKSDKGLEWYFRKQFILDSFPSDHSKSEKTLSAPLISYLNSLKNDNHRSINWKRVLRLFCNSSNRTKLVNTIHRNSKRFGTFPGVRIRKQSRILVAVDTSGSIKEDALNLFFNEIQQLWKQRTEIKIVECDTIIRRVYKYEGVSPKTIKGRGNTDFNEPIRFSNEVFHPDALIYFTDGFGPVPRLKSLKPILWVINSDGIKRHSKAWNDLQGRKVKLNVAL